MKTLFIFGSGASAKSGAPVMENFLDKAEYLFSLRSRELGDSAKSFSQVFEVLAELQGVHIKSHLDLDNIETLFAAVEMGETLGKLGKAEAKEIPQIRDSLITLIVKTLEYTMPFPVKDGRPLALDPYDKFVRGLRIFKQSDIGKLMDFSFLSFNYDLALEHALSTKGFSYHYGINEEDNRGYPLLKLHGSINWGVCRNCQEIIPVNIEEFLRRKLISEEPFYFDLGSNLTEFKHHEKPLKPIPMLVPPTWNKTSYHRQMPKVWQKATKELGEATNIFVIGYSLPETDFFFRYLFALGSESPTRIKNFVVVNPDGQAQERFTRATWTRCRKKICTHKTKVRGIHIFNLPTLRGKLHDRLSGEKLQPLMEAYVPEPIGEIEE